MYVNMYFMNDCCPPLFGEALNMEDATDLASSLKALSDPSRLRLLHLIAAAGSVCGCDLTEPTGLSQPTVSHHLKVLAEAGLVTREQRGKWAHYQLVPERLEELTSALSLSASV